MIPGGTLDLVIILGGLVDVVLCCGESSRGDGQRLYAWRETGLLSGTGLCSRHNEACPKRT